MTRAGSPLEAPFDTEESTPLIFSLESGQTLNRPLLHPTSGQTFLPAGAVLTDQLVNRIRKLGLEAETLECLKAAPRPAAAPPPPVPALPHAIPTPRRDLEPTFDKSIQTFLTSDGGGTPSLAMVLAAVKTIIQRLRQLDLPSYQALRVYGGGESAHPLNVAMFSIRIGMAMNRSHEQLVRLGQAAMLHDIGKHSLDPRLVNKSDQLTSAERRVLERHVEFGVDALLGHRASALGLGGEVIAAVQCHHERWDGTGYPRGLKKHKIPLAARILAVADAYETMTTDRPYRARRLSGEAYREILSLSGEAFDPQVIDAFRRVIVPYPNQSLLLLASGKIGHVIRQGSDPEHPIVHLGSGEGFLDLGQPGSPEIVKQLMPRLHPRLPVQIPAQIARVGTEETQAAQIADLSLGGASVATRRALAVGTPILLSLESAESGPVWLPGVVASCAKAAPDHLRLGVRFLPLSPTAKRELARHLGALRTDG